MNFKIIFIFCLFIAGCSVNSEIKSETTTPISTPAAVATPTIEPPQTASTGNECNNVNEIIGFADMSFDAKTVLNFYANPDASHSPAQTLRFYDDKTTNSYSFRAEGEKSYSALRPEAHKLDYDIFNLAVKTRRNNWLEVIVDEQKNETLWLQENKNARFKDWLQNMKNAFAVGRINPQTNSLRAKPDDKAEEINFDGKDCFEVTEMNGDWIKIKMKKHNCNEQPEQTVSGWLRWRDKNGCLLVEIFPFA